MLAVGHRKMLDLEDVPDLDTGNSVARLLRSFSANLKVLADVSGGQKVMEFKVTKALVRTGVEIYDRMDQKGLFAKLHPLR